MYFFFFKQRTAYEWRISDWSSDVCSSDLTRATPCDHTPRRSASTRILAAVLAASGSRPLASNNSPTKPDRTSASKKPVADDSSGPGMLTLDRNSVVYVKSVSVRVDPWARLIITNKT